LKEYNGRFFRLIHTIKYLKFIQVYYQIKYRLIPSKREVFKSDGTFAEINGIHFPSKENRMLKRNDMWEFNFLNRKHMFSVESFDWSYANLGMLWTFNLNYFDWLHQENIRTEDGLETIRLFYSTEHEENLVTSHPFPTSIRIVNVAKFIGRWELKHTDLYEGLLADMIVLNNRLEYNLLANHLLENAFALYIGGLITGEKAYHNKGMELLEKQLALQILADGMHYERSPMYHLIIFERLLDSLNFAIALNDDFKTVLKSFAVKMTGLTMNWRDLIRFPMMQDSAYGVALPISVLLDYSRRLLKNEYPRMANDLKDSGYRIIKLDDFYLFANVGKISPSYQPGHAHADELNFELYYRGFPIIVDTGVSTYEKSSYRLIERGTISHNCLTINGANSSEIWSGFRVGKRANLVILNDHIDELKAQHTGYDPVEVTRTWGINTVGITITDEVSLNNKVKVDNIKAEGRIHIHPDVDLIKLDKNSFKLGHFILITFQKHSSKDNIWLEEFDYALGYNCTVKSQVLVYNIQEKIKIQISDASKKNFISNR
jgi:hypothetical protein